MTGKKLSRSARKVHGALVEAGLERDILELPESTRTAAQAAAAVGCEVGQIAKSLVFRGQASGRAVLVVASGTNRVDTGRVAAVLGEPVAMPDADFVRAETGFAIGGVPPIGHLRALPTLIDADLGRYARIWAAAGNPRAVFELTLDELQRLTGGEVTDVSTPTCGPAGSG